MSIRSGQGYSVTRKCLRPFPALRIQKPNATGTWKKKDEGVGEENPYEPETGVGVPWLVRKWDSHRRVGHGGIGRGRRGRITASGGGRAAEGAVHCTGTPFHGFVLG